MVRNLCLEIRKMAGVCFIFLLLLLPLASAWGPYTHGYINKLLVEDENYQGRVASIIRNNREYYDACFIATDITVWYYYTHFSKYEATHSWSFQEEFMKLASNDKELACGYGIAAHLIQDAISHNYFVPNKIRKSYVFNFPFHPLAEAGIEAHVLKNHPEVFERYRRALLIFSQDTQLAEKFKMAASKKGVLDVETLTKTLSEVMGEPQGFYTKYFALPDVYYSFAKGNVYVAVGLLIISILIFYFKVYKQKKYSWVIPLFLVGYFAYFFFVGGLSGIADYGEAEFYLKQSVELTKQILSDSGWGGRYKYDPTGFGALKKADEDITIMWILVGVIIIVLIITYLLLSRKR